MTSRTLALSSLALALLAPGAASALTSPISGAVPLPPGFELRLPFEKDVKVKVLSGYGPGAGSSLHKDTNATGKANDHYALDLVLPDFPSSGKGQPVLTVASGTVVKAGWATEGWANYGQRVIIKHDFNDGHTYHSIYCHLDSIAVKEGDSLAAGQILGALGQSCQGALSCGSFGTPHLHWALHQDASIGGSGTGGSYGGHAVVPEFFGSYEDLSQGLLMISGNASVPKPPCLILPPAGGVLDDKGACFVKGGNPTYWYEASQGHDGHLWWTNATADAATDNWARWDIHPEQAGDFHVEVHTEPSFALSTQAKYIVRHGGKEKTVAVDQSKGAGWQSLGAFPFAQGGDQWVRLNDNTGEDLSLKHKLVFDAVRLSPPDPGAGGSGQAGGQGGTSSSGGQGSGNSGGSGSGGQGNSGGQGTGNSGGQGTGNSGGQGSGNSGGQGSGNSGGSVSSGGSGQGGSPAGGAGPGGKGGAAAGEPGAAGSGAGSTSGGKGGKGGSSGKGGGDGKAGAGSSVTVVLEDPPAEDSGSCSSARGRPGGAAALALLALALRGLRRQRR